MLVLTPIQKTLITENEDNLKKFSEINDLKAKILDRIELNEDNNKSENRIRRMNRPLYNIIKNKHYFYKEILFILLFIFFIIFFKKKKKKYFIYNVEKKDIDNNGYVQILGNEFVENNQNKIYLIIDGKKHKLFSKYKLDLGIHKVEIIGYEKIFDYRHFFERCTSLIGISPFEDWDVSNVTLYDGLFCGCHSLRDISPISNWDVRNAESFIGSFAQCKQLTDISPLSKWNIGEVITLESLFAFSDKLADLSPISNWDVRNVNSFAATFYGCFSLKNIYPLMKWEISPNADKSYIFKETKIAILDIFKFHFPKYFKNK